MTDATNTGPELLTQKELAARLGCGVSAVKKWRGHTLAALTEAGQRRHETPTVPLPRNALPLPANHVDHVRLGVPPVWEWSVVARWAERTQRRHPVTKEFTRPDPPGRPYGPSTGPQRRAA